METPIQLFTAFHRLGETAKKNIAELMKSHDVRKLNTKVYMFDYNYDYTDISVYDRKMDCIFYEPISSVTLDENDNVHLFYNGEESGECYEPTTTDWLNVFSLVYEILKDVNANLVELHTTDDE
jgi:hypothetical protein